MTYIRTHVQKVPQLYRHWGIRLSIQHVYVYVPVHRPFRRHRNSIVSPYTISIKELSVYYSCGFRVDGRQQAAGTNDTVRESNKRFCLFCNILASYLVCMHWCVCVCVCVFLCVWMVASTTILWYNINDTVGDPVDMQTSFDHKQR